MCLTAHFRYCFHPSTTMPPMINQESDLKQSVISSPPLHLLPGEMFNGVMQRRNTMYHNPAADEEHRQRADNR